MADKAINKLNTFMGAFIKEKCQLLRNKAHTQIDHLFDDLTKEFADQMSSELSGNEFLKSLFADPPQLTSTGHSGYYNSDSVAAVAHHYYASQLHHQKYSYQPQQYSSSFLENQGSSVSWSNSAAASAAAAAAAAVAAAAAANAEANNLQRLSAQQQQHYQMQSAQRGSHIYSGASGPLANRDVMHSGSSDLDISSSSSIESSNRYDHLDAVRFSNSSFCSAGTNSSSYAAKNHNSTSARACTTTITPVNQVNRANYSNLNSSYNNISGKAKQVKRTKSNSHRNHSSSSLSSSSSSPSTGSNRSSSSSSSSPLANTDFGINSILANVRTRNNASQTSTSSTESTQADTINSINSNQQHPLSISVQNSTSVESNDDVQLISPPYTTTSTPVLFGYPRGKSSSNPNNSNPNNSASTGAQATRKRPHLEDGNTTQNGASQNTSSSTGAGKRSKPFRGALIKCDIPECTVYLENGSALNSHLVKVHDLMPYYCLLCSASFTSTGRLKDHIEREHAEVVKYICHHCHSAYPGYRNLSIHFKRTHFRRQYKCSVDGCTFTSNQSCKVLAHIERGDHN